MLALLPLAAFVCVGLSDVVVEQYGATHVMNLPRDTHSIEHSDLETRVLWKYDDPSYSSQDTRLHMTHSSFMIRNVTQSDSGLYVVRNQYNYELKRWTLKVKENKESHKLASGQQLRVSFDLEPNSCNIYFIPKTNKDAETRIVGGGELQTGLEKLNCSGFELLKPCGILIKDPQMSCEGNFEIRDDNDDKALVMEQRKSDTPKDPLFTAIGVTVGVVALIGCCCVKCCKCLGSSDKSVSETQTEAAATPQECNNGPGPSQPLMPCYPVPSYTYSEPLVHDPPAVKAENVVVPAPADAATVLSLGDDEPRFELKGVNFPLSLPLSSDSSYQDVYTSDKLNFK